MHGVNNNRVIAPFHFAGLTRSSVICGNTL